MEVRERDAAIAAVPGHLHAGVERGERDAHVGGMRRNAMLARAQDRVHAVDAVDRGAAGARLALVARRGGVVEVQAARALQQIAAVGRHVAQLRRRAGEDRIGEQRIARLDLRVVGDVAVGHQRAEPQPAVLGLLDRVERQSVMSMRCDGRATFSFIRSMRLVPPAMNRGRVRRDLAHGVGDVARARIGEIVHRRLRLLRALPNITSSIAATMFG